MSTRKPTCWLAPGGPRCLLLACTRALSVWLAAPADTLLLCDGSPDADDGHRFEATHKGRSNSPTSWKSIGPRGMVDYQGKAQPSLGQRPDRLEYYNYVMRYYTINSKGSNSVIFTCTLCSYRVNTLDFNRANGHVRTQAAADINKHVAASHLRPKPWSAAVPSGARLVGHSYNFGR